MIHFIGLLLLERCWSSAIHGTHSEDDILGPVMRRESRSEAESLHQEAVTSTVKALDPLNPDSYTLPYRDSVVVHIPAKTTESTTTTSSTTIGTRGTMATSTQIDIQKLAEEAEEAAEAASQAADEAKWRARLSTASTDEATEAPPDQADQADAVPFTPGEQAATSVQAALGTAAPQTAAPETAETAEPETTQYSRKYTTTSRRTMTIQVTTATTSLVTQHHSTAAPSTATIPLKIPAHMHPVVAPGSHFPEELSAASWRSLQARISTSTTSAMTVEESMDAAAKVAQTAAERAGASEEDAAVEAAKAAWMQHEQTKGHSSGTSSTSTTSSWVTYVTDVPSKADATAQMESAYAAAAQSIKKKYEASQIPFSSNRTIKVVKEMNLTGRPMRVRVITGPHGDIAPTEAPEDEEVVSTTEPRSELDKMEEMLDEVVLKDLPQVVAAAAAKISRQPFESDIAKAASRMVVKMLTETPVKDVPDAIVRMLIELAVRERPQVENPVPMIARVLRKILDDYQAPEKESISEVVEQAIESAKDAEEARTQTQPPSPEPPQSQKVIQVITDVADRLAKKGEANGDSENEAEDTDDTTTPEATEEVDTTEAAIPDADTEGEAGVDTEEANSTANATTGDGAEGINSAEVLPDEDQAYTAAETMKSAKEHKSEARPQSSQSPQRPIAVHSVHPGGSNVVKAVSPQDKEHAGSGGDDDRDEEEELEVESPAKSGGKVLVGLTIFLGGLLMVVAITSAAYMAYQRRQEQRPPQGGAAVAEQASAAPAAAAPATAAPARASGVSRASAASAAPEGAAPEDAVAPTFTGGPEAGA